MPAYAYYNEIDPLAAEWLRRLIARGIVAPGEVDERDIRDVTPAELSGFTQCHFFAGIGIWSGALRRAGWPDDRPIWTGSCPCQPFSAAGERAGFDDERHLWPAWHWLIEQGRPSVVLGEQVAGKDGFGWFDLVSADLAGIGYARGAVDLAAAGFGMVWRGSAEQERLERAIRLCPDAMVARHLSAFAEWADQALALGGQHIRQRLYFVGVADGDRKSLGGGGDHGPREIARESQGAAFQRSTGLRPTGELSADGLHDAQHARLEGHERDGDRAQGRPQEDRPDAQRGGAGQLSPRDRQGRSGGLLDADGGKPEIGKEQPGGQLGLSTPDRGDARARDHGPRPDADGGQDAYPDNGRGGDQDWLLCRDGFWRSVEAGTFPLAHENTARVGRLRAYGNGLDFETATEFCRAVMGMLDG